jgi:hypothetical protein
MEADPNKLKHRNSFNVTAMQVTPASMADSIRQHIPDFRINYEIDPMRQAIADSRPNSMNDICARAER